MGMQYFPSFFMKYRTIAVLCRNTDYGREAIRHLKQIPMMNNCDFKIIDPSINYNNYSFDGIIDLHNTRYDNESWYHQEIESRMNK